jgi:phosphoglycerate kinase
MVKVINDLNVKDKKVFVRCDLDATYSEETITDPTRLISCISTIEYLLENGAVVIAGGHLGRPEGVDEKYSLRLVAKWYANQFNSEISDEKLGDFKAWKIKENFFMLENLRFFKEEEDNDPDFSRKLADLADIYVNEAFGSSHRKHVSTYGVAELMPQRFAGFHLAKEMKILNRILENPIRPLIIIMGGAKIETKLPLISKMHTVADYVLVGGELAEQTKVLAHEEHRKITGQKAELIVADMVADNSDITEGSVKEFEEIIYKNGMIVWNGPMGFLEKGKEETSLRVARAIISSKAYKIVGGGDTVSFLNKHKMMDEFDFASVGGGAMLEFLSGEKLPGIEILEK